MAENLLVLFPRDIHQAIDPTAIIRQLRAIRFIDEPFQRGERQHYKPGDDYLALLTFLGCSPVVSLGEPGKTGDEFAHVCVEQYGAPVCLYGENVKAPRCPDCGHRHEEIDAAVEHWVETPLEPWHCPSCENPAIIPRLKWRQCAAFGRTFVKIWGVFEGEAVPSEALMATLRSVSGDVEWRYAYVRTPND